MELAVIDFETTGLSAGRDRIIEVGAVILRDGGVADSFVQLMHPGFPIPSFITGLTGISNAMVRDMPPPEEVMPGLRQFLDRHPCLAHNASFDSRFLAAEMARAGLGHERPFLCSMRLARRLVTDAPNHRLGTLVEHLGLRPPDGCRAHRALDDVLMTVALWNHLADDLTNRLGRTPDFAFCHRLMTRPKAAVAKFLLDAAVSVP